MKPFRSLILLLLMGAVLFLLPLSAEATIFWDDDFASGPPNYYGTGGVGQWLFSGTTEPEGVNPKRVTTQARSGAHSIRSHFDYECGEQPNPTTGLAPGCGGFMDRVHPRTIDVWFRWWVKYVNFTANTQTGSKNFYHGANGVWMQQTYHIFMRDNRMGGQSSNHWDQRDCFIVTNGQHGGLSPTCNHRPNLASVNVLDGNWHCIEGHINPGTPGNYDGLWDVWVDGTKTMEFHTVNYLAPTEPLQGWDWVRHYAQVGLGDRFVDDVAVGNTRIGCGSGPAVAPPNVPTNLLLSKLWRQIASLLNLSFRWWTV